MTLADAIRLGAMVKPQAFGIDDDEHGGTCAFAAALDAIGRPRMMFSAFVYAEHQWPWLRQTAHCPRCEVVTDATALVLHLNDDHHWPREQIADWVETIDPRVVEPSVARVGETVAQAKG